MNGIVNVYKPSGITSHDVIYRVRRISGIKKVGHTGTLDPGAEGVLPVCIGNGTKLADMLTVSDKRYTADMHLGIETDTQDLSGNVLRETIQNTAKADIVRVLADYTGELMQTPPMYSAVKVGGKKLYELARKGLTAEVKARPVTIYGIELLNFDGSVAKIDVRCSKGTYIRTLCHDIGKSLGCGAAMGSLIRTESAGFTVDEAVTLDVLERDGIEKYLIPSDMMFDYEKLTVGGEMLRRVLNGNSVDFAGEEKRYRVYDENGCFLCVSEASGGMLKMIKCFFGGR